MVIDRAVRSAQTCYVVPLSQPSRSVLRLKLSLLGVHLRGSRTLRTHELPQQGLTVYHESKPLQAFTLAVKMQLKKNDGLFGGGHVRFSNAFPCRCTTDGVRFCTTSNLLDSPFTDGLGELEECARLCIL